MKKFHYKHIQLLIIPWIIFCFYLFGGIAGAQQEKIHISAERLISDTEAKFTEFIGNVKAVQGKTTITADKLKIFYQTASKGKKKDSSKESAIKKIVAQGNVKIRFDNKVAETQEAVYTTKDKVLTLSGDPSKIVSGNDSVSGSKITLYRQDGRIKVEGTKKKRVEAVFYPGEQGLE